MQTVALTPTVSSTRIGFGCAGLMRESSEARRQQVLEAAFEQGIRHFDVARMYGLGAAERELGRFARARREQLVIVTKFGIEAGAASGRLARLQGPARRLLARYPWLRAQVKRRSDAFHQPHRYDVATARASLERSLRELGTDYVDLLLLHGPTAQDAVDVPELCAYLEEARAAGQIRGWGVAGESADSLQVARALAGAVPPPAVAPGVGRDRTAPGAASLDAAALDAATLDAAALDGTALDAAAPGATVVQIRDDSLAAPTPSQLGLRAPITFGVLAQALGRIVAHMSADPARRARWSLEIGVDCADRQALAALLVRDALARNRRGVVLVATTRPERLAGVGELVAEADAEGELATAAASGGQLAAFRRLVQRELLRNEPAAERADSPQAAGGSGRAGGYGDAD
jgi:hypothetical protein